MENCDSRGAGRTDSLGNNFKKLLDEHYFLTDPDEMIYTHFPHDEVFFILF